VYGLYSDVIAADKKMTFRNQYNEIMTGIKQGDPKYATSKTRHLGRFLRYYFLSYLMLI